MVLGAALLLVGLRVVAAQPVWLEVSQAVAGTDERTGKPLVSFVLTGAGREVFARFTAAHVGRRVDLRVDGRSVGRPMVVEPVNGGVGQIPVASTEEGRLLAERLRGQDARLEVEATD